MSLAIADSPSPLEGEGCAGLADDSELSRSWMRGRAPSGARARESAIAVAPYPIACCPIAPCGIQRLRAVRDGETKTLLEGEGVVFSLAHAQRHTRTKNNSRMEFWLEFWNFAGGLFLPELVFAHLGRGGVYGSLEVGHIGYASLDE